MKVKNGMASRQVVGDDAVQLIGEIAEEVGTYESELDADEAKNRPAAASENAAG